LKFLGFPEFMEFRESAEFTEFVKFTESAEFRSSKILAIPGFPHIFGTWRIKSWNLEKEIPEKSGIPKISQKIAIPSIFSSSKVSR
jgi:hypothetical protein